MGYYGGMDAKQFRLIAEDVLNCLPENIGFSDAEMEKIERRSVLEGAS